MTNERFLSSPSIFYYYQCRQKYIYTTKWFSGPNIAYHRQMKDFPAHQVSSFIINAVKEMSPQTLFRQMFFSSSENIKAIHIPTVMIMVFSESNTSTLPNGFQVIYLLSNPNIAYGWVNSAPANDLGLALVPEVAGRVAVQVQASPSTEGGLDYTEQEEDFHRRGQGLVEKVEEVEEPDRVAELVGVADEEQQLVGDLVDSCP